MSNIITEVENARLNYEKRFAAFESNPSFRNDYWKDIAYDKYLDKLEELKKTQ